jgi:hypothetical protein
LSRAAVERLAIDTARACADLAIFDATQGGGDLLAIEAAVGALTGGSGQCLIVIDSLHQWAAGLTAATGATEYDGLGAALAALTAIASSTGSPVLTIAHRNRRGQRGGGGLHAAKGHGGIEYAAESVIDLNLDESQKFEVTAEGRPTGQPDARRTGMARQGRADLAIFATSATVRDLDRQRATRQISQGCGDLDGD